MIDGAVTIDANTCSEPGPVWSRRLGRPCPVAIASTLQDQPGVVWLDGAAGATDSWSYICCDPIDWVSAEAGETSDALAKLDAWLGDHALAAPRQAGWPPFLGGAVGYLSYEATFDLLNVAPSRHLASAPVLEFGLYDTLIAIDHRTGDALALSRGLAGPGGVPNRVLAEAKLADLSRRLGARASRPSPPTLDWQATTDRAAHLARVRRAQDYIRAGDIYQANLAQTFTADHPGADYAFDLYLALRKANPAPHAAWLDFPGRQIASTSPERLICSTADGHVEARPIKGTIRRSTDHAEDEQLRLKLLASDKDRAENIMIVDLLRNDLSRVCTPHSVRVPQLCGLESYAGLHHLTSVVTGELQADASPVDLLRAVFPGGSVTGAPKARAVEIIDELEATPRGAFCGSLGYIGFDGAMDFNILIRTIDLVAAEASLTIGGGITLLSDPEAEHQESLLKGARIMAASSRDVPAA